MYIRYYFLLEQRFVPHDFLLEHFTMPCPDPVEALVAAARIERLFPKG